MVAGFAKPIPLPHPARFSLPSTNAAGPLARTQFEVAMNFLRRIRRIRRIRDLVVLSGLWLTAPVVFAQTSPVGSWDIVLGGRYQRGLAQVTFQSDGTLDGVAVFTILGTHLFHTNGSYIYRHILGSAAVQGEWVQAGPNRITGFLNLIGSGATAGETNGFSLSGVTQPTRLNLLAHGPAGKVTLRGLPLIETNLSSLPGTNYVGRAQLRHVPFPLIEIFNPTEVAPNHYAIAGGGPGYEFQGTLLISRQRQAALYQERTTVVTGSDLAAFAGPFNFLRRTGTLKGCDGVNLGMRYRFAPGAR